MAVCQCKINLNKNSMANVSNEVYAAIAMALHEFKGNNVHDKESGIITIKHCPTQWNSRMMMMTQHP
jgi:hypothetical protein